MLVALGLGLAIWARAHIGRNWGLPMSRKAYPELVTSGPYAVIRHPIYVGILLAALYDPVWTAGITSRGDFALAVGAFLLLFMWKTPPWLVVILSAIGGAAIAAP